LCVPILVHTTQITRYWVDPLPCLSPSLSKKQVGQDWVSIPVQSLIGTGGWGEMTNHLAQNIGSLMSVWLPHSIPTGEQKLCHVYLPTSKLKRLIREHQEMKTARCS
jgi:hypothetical protein